MEDGDRAFSPRPGLPHPNLIQEMGLRTPDFNRKFKGSPVKRSKRRGYLRNVAVGLGNCGDREAVPVLVEALFNDPETPVRRHAAWALGEIGGDTAREGLRASLKREEDTEVLDEIRAALSHIDGNPTLGD
jgi:epoxyqueuosine reductase